MEGLQILDYWCFVKYLSYHSLMMLCRSEPTAVLPKMPESATKSPEDSEASLSLIRRQMSRRRRAAKSALVVPSPLVLEDSTLVVTSLVFMEDPNQEVSGPVVQERSESTAEPTPVFMMVSLGGLLVVLAPLRWFSASPLLPAGLLAPPWPGVIWAERLVQNAPACSAGDVQHFITEMT